MGACEERRPSPPALLLFGGGIVARHKTAGAATAVAAINDDDVGVVGLNVPALVHHFALSAILEEESMFPACVCFVLLGISTSLADATLAIV